MNRLLSFGRLLLVLACVVWLPAGVWARTAVPIHLAASAGPSPVHPGEVVTLTVKATVDPRWHVYSVLPTPGLPPTEAPATTEITSFGDWPAVGPTTEDKPLSKQDPNFHAVVSFHEGMATFSRQFRVPANAAVTAPAAPSAPSNGGAKTPDIAGGLGNATPAPPELGAGGAALTLHYQTCNDKICLPPTNVQIPVTVAVAPGSVRSQYAKGTSQGLGAGALSFFLLAIGGGLLAIVTPCVFPLIPITLTNFVKQAEGSQAKLVRLSFGYALGIVALYVALGAVCAALLGGRANNIAANPWVNLIEFVLFVVFALSFFETIQITLPGNLGALQQSARKHGGTAGLVLLGVTFVLGSFTCTAPFVGTLLVSAAGGQWLRPILGMLVFALAFASPFFVFALFPQWIGRIPKGGVWLARFKATLGFIELAAALKFLSNADQVWQWKLLTQPVLLAAWAVVFVCAALYLWGTLRFGTVAETETAQTRVPLSRRLTASVFALIALYCFWGLTGRPISPYVSAFLPPDGYGGVTMAATSGLPWLSDYPTALAEAKAQGKPLLIDFTGYTCTNCRLNEKNVFPRSAVQAKLADYVRVQLYTDGKDDAANQALQETKFGDIALPLYGIVDPQTEAVIDKTEGVQTVGGFTQFLAKSVPASNPGTAGTAGNSSVSGNGTPAPPELGAGGPSSLWSPYTPRAVAAATQAGRPVIVDFTAKWCVNCKEIEKDVFEDPAVKPALGRDFVTLRADLTQWTSPSSVALQKQYGFGALPTIVFLDKTGTEIKSLRITGRLPVADFQKRMATAR